MQWHGTSSRVMSSVQRRVGSFLLSRRLAPTNCEILAFARATAPDRGAGAKPRRRSTAWRVCRAISFLQCAKSRCCGCVLLARAQGDDTGYRDYRDRYRDMATSLGFEGHIAWAEAMA
jgi:hypothetical protein